MFKSQEQNIAAAAAGWCAGERNPKNLSYVLHSLTYFKGAQIAEARYDGLPHTHTPSAPTIWLAATALCTGTPESRVAWVTSHKAVDVACSPPESCSEPWGWKLVNTPERQQQYYYRS